MTPATPNPPATLTTTARQAARATTTRAAKVPARPFFPEGASPGAPDTGPATRRIASAPDRRHPRARTGN
jgi:hypothetical protein